MKTRRAAVYLRVSTVRQDLALQRREIADFIRRRGWTAVANYAEKKSGADATRPELDKMLQDARAGRFDAIVIYKLDRLGRSSLHLAQIAEEMHARKIAIVTASEGIDTSDENPMGRFVLEILAAVARLERERIVERVRSGVAAAKERGVKFGRPPEISAETAIRIHMLAGEKDSWGKPKHSLREIAALAGVGLGTVTRALGGRRKSP